jgi:hypothetical protein
MKSNPLFYCFGTGKGKKLFSITEPIVIRDNFIVKNFNEHPSKELKEALKLVDEWRGTTGLCENPKNLLKFISHARVISPDVRGKIFNIFFLDDEKSILLKAKKDLSTWEELKNKIWDFIEPFKIISKKEYYEKIKKWDLNDDCTSAQWCVSEKMKMHVYISSSLFICIHPKNYLPVKKKIQKIHKN